VQDTHITDGYAFSHEVKVDLNMIGALVLNGVHGKVYDTDVLVVDECDLLISGAWGS
jgi:hypothetical protein